ncbi:uncharacterized protein SPPG_09479 [Spizellomyces punctatus DAOM BR117]|uniref:Uncharacterized protein n=1 Tax=Spizellomyces punctatus (strain DAOM BR117) TaxID=645134 RepID=A0A0L0H8B2_SPIPD|nr:uncharacterized protein SPPG_09479 [Spizellomyces punctatus DAOM BR117]KNC97196.1 hypothetical protein SPPG_09479 [Spizellomyces punctatus DAOM BR117]|eukprot:XP_016605236.1 hypothetical protein SPPG_09479 [Spizellomyces punctatus DAOM BR117]
MFPTRESSGQNPYFPRGKALSTGRPILFKCPFPYIPLQRHNQQLLNPKIHGRLALYFQHIFVNTTIALRLVADPEVVWKFGRGIINVSVMHHYTGAIAAVYWR